MTRAATEYLLFKILTPTYFTTSLDNLSLSYPRGWVGLPTREGVPDRKLNLTMIELLPRVCSPYRRHPLSGMLSITLCWPQSASQVLPHPLLCRWGEVRCKDLHTLVKLIRENFTQATQWEKISQSTANQHKCLSH